MSVIEESVEIKCPGEKIFTFTTDAKSWTKWHGAIPEAEQTSQGEIGIGTTFKGKNRMMGQTFDWTAKLTEYEPYKKWCKVIDSGNVIIDDKFIFDPMEQGTRFTMVYDVKVTGFLKLLSLMINNSMRKQLKTDLNNLKNILEFQG